MSKAWILSGLILLIVILGLIYLYQWKQSDTLPQIGDQYKVVGIIDWENKRQGPDYNSVREGIDGVLVVDHTNPFYSQLMAKFPETAKNPDDPRFHLQFYDETGDGLLDSEDSIWPHLFVLVYSPDSKTYTVKSLPAAGIRAIILKHLTTHGNHSVVLSNGEERILYEITKWEKVKKDQPYISDSSSINTPPTYQSRISFF